MGLNCRAGYVNEKDDLETHKNYNIIHSHYLQGQRVDTIKREMFSQKSVRRFVGDSSAFVMGAMFLASALNRGISPRY